MMTYLWIAIGSALGGMARYWCAELALTAWGDAFPWGTLLINMSGSFVIGFFAALTGAGGHFAEHHTMRQFVLVGLCGGYTTFSSFSLQTLNLIYQGEAFRAGLNIILSIVLCLIAVWLGTMAGVALNQMKHIA